MYFKNFQNIYYLYNINGKEELKVVKDITTNVRFRKAILENITLYDEYDYKEGDTPEIIAAKYYGSAEYHWVVMLVNQRFDYLNDFPKPYHVFETYVQDKYGDELYDTHHYELNGFVVDAGTAGASEISNYQYEERLNESKRRIKLINPALLTNLLAQYNSII